MATEKSLTDDQLTSAIFNFKDLVEEDLFSARLAESNTRVDLYRSIEDHLKNLKALIGEQIIRAIAKHDFEAMAKANYASFVRNRIDEDTLSHLIETDDENGETRRL